MYCGLNVKITYICAELEALVKVAETTAGFKLELLWHATPDGIPVTDCPWIRSLQPHFITAISNYYYYHNITLFKINCRFSC